MNHLTRGASAALALALLLTGCSDDVPSPGQSRVDVDTPELRELKADAGIETCEPGPGGGGLPDLTLACLGGGPDVELSSLTGPLLINLWFSGCGPCRDEMPALQAFHEKHGDEVGVLGIDVEVYPDLAISFADLVGATYPQLADPGGTVFDDPDLQLRSGFPQFIVLDAAGDVVHQSAGGLDSLAEVEAYVEESLGLKL